MVGGLLMVGLLTLNRNSSSLQYAKTALVQFNNLDNGGCYPSPQGASQAFEL